MRRKEKRRAENKREENEREEKVLDYTQSNQVLTASIKVCTKVRVEKKRKSQTFNVLVALIVVKKGDSVRV